MKREIIELKFNISYRDIANTEFKITESPVTKRDLFSFNPRMYLAEYAKIVSELDKLHLNFNDIVQVGYISGMTRPFGIQNMPIAMSVDYYTVILKISRQREESIEEKKNQILKKFQTAPMGTATKLYRELALKYHPDRGGNEELMKYVNTLKDRYK